LKLDSPRKERGTPRSLDEASQAWIAGFGFLERAIRRINNLRRAGRGMTLAPEPASIQFGSAGSPYRRPRIIQLSGEEETTCGFALRDSLSF
jgi:hypothetical protein